MGGTEEWQAFHVDHASARAVRKEPIVARLQSTCFMRKCYLSQNQENAKKGRLLNAGRRTDFRDKNRELFSGELFSGEIFSGAVLLSENFVPINVCGVDSFSPN